MRGDVRQFARTRRNDEWQETDVALNYDIYDVFTETKLAGNPLAVMY
ncbi:phenazine biosynthesis protein PhzF, partial [Rhizobium sp. BR5]